MAGSCLLPTGVVLALVVLTAGCIAYAVPTDSWESGSLDDYEFEARIGSTSDEILTDLGQPTYVLASHELNESYYLYERDRFVETEWGYAGIAKFGVYYYPVGDWGRETNKNGMACYLLVFNANDSLMRHEVDWIRYAPETAAEARSSVVRTDAPGQPLRSTQNLDCREFYWSREELSDMTTVDLH
jgi:outer membrane protein assembly factor BamE (lipoprotein component of BamABCDE complex)